MRLPKWITHRLLLTLMYLTGAPSRYPDYIIGEPDRHYLRRWWVIPRNRIFNIYLHEILVSDDDRALHDHPWWNLSVILLNEYQEVKFDGTYLRKRGSVLFRRGETAHRLVVPDPNKRIWTLFITGPNVRQWGFHCPKGWRHWKDFCEPGAKGRIGKGCD